MTRLQEFLEAQAGRSCNLARMQDEYRVNNDLDEICEGCGEQPAECRCEVLVVMPWPDGVYPITPDSQCLTVR